MKQCNGVNFLYIPICDITKIWNEECVIQLGKDVTYTPAFTPFFESTYSAVAPL